VRGGGDEKTPPCVEPKNHSGIDDGDGGKAMRCSGTPVEAGAPSMATVKESGNGVGSTVVDVMGRDGRGGRGGSPIRNLRNRSNSSRIPLMAAPWSLRP
jgi:hypothetical protein